MGIWVSPASLVWEAGLLVCCLAFLHLGDMLAVGEQPCCGEVVGFACFYCLLCLTAGAELSAVFGFDVAFGSTLLGVEVVGGGIGDYASCVGYGGGVDALDEEETACDNGEGYEDGYQFLVHVISI